MKKLTYAGLGLGLCLLIVAGGIKFFPRDTPVPVISPLANGTITPACNQPLKAHESILIAKCLLGSDIKAPVGVNLHPMVFGKPSGKREVYVSEYGRLSELPKVGLVPLLEDTFMRNKNRFQVITDSVLDANKMLLTPMQFTEEAIDRRSVHLSQLPVVSGYWEQKRIDEMLRADGFSPEEYVTETVLPLDAKWDNYSVVKLFRGSLNGKDMYAALALSPFQPESFRLAYAKHDDPLIKRLKGANPLLQPSAFQLVYLSWERRDKATPGVTISTSDVTRSELGLVTGNSTDPYKFKQSSATICLRVEADAISQEMGTFCTDAVLDTQP